MNNDLNNDRLLIVNFGGHTQWNSIFKLLEGKKKTQSTQNSTPSKDILS